MMNNLLLLLVSFGKIGLVSLGGGNSMLKLIETESVSYRHWVQPEEFVQMVGTTFLFPGLTAVKLAALIGYKAAGWLGLLLAVVSLNLPGLFLVMGGYYLLNKGQYPVLNKINIVVQYGALALLAAACVSLGQSIFQSYASWPICLFTLLFFLVLTVSHTSPFWGFLLFIGCGFFLIR